MSHLSAHVTRWCSVTKRHVQDLSHLGSRWTKLPNGTDFASEGHTLRSSNDKLLCENMGLMLYNDARATAEYWAARARPVNWVEANGSSLPMARLCSGNNVKWTHELVGDGKTTVDVKGEKDEGKGAEVKGETVVEGRVEVAVNISDHWRWRQQIMEPMVGVDVRNAREVASLCKLCKLRARSRDEGFIIECEPQYA